MPTPIVEADGIFLADGHQGDPAVFIAAFSEVWAKIPDGYKSLIKKDWARVTKDKGKPYPLITLTDDYHLAAENADRGSEIHFNGKCVAMIPHEFVLALIAHELGHVWHYLKGGWIYKQPKEHWKERECEADNLAKHWGFDTAGLRKWANENGTEMAKATGTEAVYWTLDCSAFKPLIDLP